MCIRDMITPKQTASTNVNYISPYNAANPLNSIPATSFNSCLLYTSDAADERSSVDLGGRRIINNKKPSKL